jgi:hypothetical protein
MTSCIDPSVKGDVLKGTILLCIGTGAIEGKSFASAS